MLQAWLCKVLRFELILQLVFKLLDIITIITELVSEQLGYEAHVQKSVCSQSCRTAGLYILL